jgi:malate dehydrogenase (oxaloacetate-decarboxylating)(NADP+)
VPVQEVRRHRRLRHRARREDPDKLVEIIAALEPTLGGVNLEDIKAPECFYVEKKLRERMNIPVFHDDQHGTAIISAAALLNGLELVGKKIGDVKLAVSGAGAAAIACLDVMVGLGIRRENVWVVDSKGVLREDREDFSRARPTRASTATASAPTRARSPTSSRAPTSSSAARRQA